MVFFDKLGTLSISAIAAALVLLGIFSGTAFVTARALIDESPAKLRRIAMWLNWSFIGFYVLGIVATVLGTFAKPDVMHRMLAAMAPGFLSLVIPQLINICALRCIQSSSANAA